MTKQYNTLDHAPYTRRYEYQTPLGAFKTYEEAIKALEACDYDEFEPVPVPLDTVNKALASFRSLL